VSLISATSVNTLPTSANPANNALAATAYRKTETRIQLSVRTKLAQGILTSGHPTLKDSLWFGYTQQSYWQLFNGGISRPFRSTDHEPELVYVYPTDFRCPAAGVCATAAWAWCTSPTARRCRCRAAGTAPT
jgi:phospholipase A1